MTSREPEVPPPIEWHRADRAHGAKRTIVLAAFLVTLGATAVGATFVSRFSDALGHGVALLGACTMLSGLILGVGSALVMLQEDSYLAVRADGILLHFGRDREVVLPWTTLAAIEANDAGAVVLTRESGEREEWPVGAGAPELARRLADLRKKAALGILPRV